MNSTPLATLRSRVAGFVAALFVASLAPGCKTARLERPWPWYTFQPPDRSFKVLFPESRPLIRRTVHGDTRRTDYSSREGMTTFMVQVLESARFRRESAEALLRDYPNPRAAGIQGRVVSETSVRMGRYPGREVRIEGTVKAAPGLVVQIQRAYVADSRMFVVHASAVPGRPLSPNARRFLDSFEIFR